jgi:hypothetical protein
MRSVSTIALAASLALGGAALTEAPASAQKAQAAELSAEERAAFLALNNALAAKDYGAATSALAIAQSRARSANARYMASALQLRLGLETNNRGLQATAIDAMIGSGAAPASELPQLYRNQAALLQAAGKSERAEAVLTRYVEAAPNDPDALLALAQIKDTRRKPQEAVALIERAVDMRKAAGQVAPESWYKRGVALALMHKMPAPSLKFARELVANYPSVENWRDALLVYRDMAAPDPESALDSWRLQRAAKALAGERDYEKFAVAATAAGLPAESKAVLDEGVAAKMVSPTEGTFKALIASSTKAAATARAGLKAKEAAAMAAAMTHYRTALQKGSIDPNVVNTRLGIALAMAGQRAEAETAFRAVTGPRGELAALWLTWLGRPA